MRPNCPELILAMVPPAAWSEPGSPQLNVLNRLNVSRGELQRLHPDDADVAGNSQIHVPEMRPHEAVPFLVAVRAGLGLDKRCAIEIVGQRPLLRIHVGADPVRPLVPLPGERAVDPGRDVDTVAGPLVENAGEAQREASTPRTPLPATAVS